MVLDMEYPLELPVRLMSKVYMANLNTLKSTANDDGFERGTRSILAFVKTAFDKCFNNHSTPLFRIP